MSSNYIDYETRIIVLACKFGKTAATITSGVHRAVHSQISFFNYQRGKLSSSLYASKNHSLIHQIRTMAYFFLITVLFRCENDTYLNMQITNNNNKHKTIHRGSPTIQSSGKVDWIMKWPEKITSGKLLYTLRHIVTITLSQSISVIDISIFTSPLDIQRFRIRNVCNIIVLYIFYSIFHGCCLRRPYWARQNG